MIEQIKAKCDAIRQQIEKVVIGQDEIIYLMMVSLFAKGHILLEGVPGTAKTLLAQTFAQCFSLDFRRIQFTPDLMPGDILGSNIFNFKTSEFELTKGPVFTELLLADEINRTPPKTQAALLQAMQERYVTIDNSTMDLGEGFMVIATQNPIEQQGTYPLPEAQLDRFLFKLIIDYPDRDAEVRITNLHGNTGGMPKLGDFGLNSVMNLEEVIKIRHFMKNIKLEADLVAYLVDLVRATRELNSLQVGGSTRTINMLATAARAVAMINGRDYVIPDDIKEIFVPGLRHKVILSPSAEMERMSSDNALEQVKEQIEAPK